MVIINERIKGLEITLKGKEGNLIPLILDANLVKDKINNLVYFELLVIEKYEPNSDEMQMKQDVRCDATT